MGWKYTRMPAEVKYRKSQDLSKLAADRAEVVAYSSFESKSIIYQLERFSSQFTK
jgi:hypothetical protein